MSDVRRPNRTELVCTCNIVLPAGSPRYMVGDTFHHSGLDWKVQRIIDPAMRDSIGPIGDTTLVLARFDEVGTDIVKRIAREECPSVQ